MGLEQSGFPTGLPAEKAMVQEALEVTGTVYSV